MSSVHGLPQTRSFNVDAKGVPSKVRSWRVETNSKTDDGEVAVGLVGLVRGTIWGSVVLLDCNADCVTEDGLQWIVTANYGIPDEEDDPLDEPAEVDWSFAQFRRDTERDIQGRAILNSAKDPYVDP